MADWEVEFKLRWNGRLIVNLKRSHTSRSERRRMAAEAAAPRAAPPQADPDWWKSRSADEAKRAAPKSVAERESQDTEPAKSCVNCGARIALIDGTWVHDEMDKIFCPGGEPFGEMATPEP